MTDGNAEKGSGMERSALVGLVAVLLSGCSNPTKPEISAIDPSLPFDKAMETVIQKDEFLTLTLRPGFHRTAAGTIESYALSPDEEGSITAEHLVLLTNSWCNQNGGKVGTYPEMPILQRGIGNVLQRDHNIPVAGNAYNLICFRGAKPLAGAAIGRTNYFLNANQFREAMSQAGGTILHMQPPR